MGEEGELRDVTLSTAGPPTPETTKPSSRLFANDQSNSHDSHDEVIAGDAQMNGVDEKKEKDNYHEKLLRPPAYLPQPEAPPGLAKAQSTGPEECRTIDRSISVNSSTVDVSAIGKYLRDRGTSFSVAIAKRISSLKEPGVCTGNIESEVTVFHLSGMKVIVRLKGENDYVHSGAGGETIKGRISFFSRSGCRDCGAVRSFFRERGLGYVEINLDVFQEREAELVERTGGSSVPAIFFNERLVGGLVALNSLRNSGELDRRLGEMAGRRCPETAPRIPSYGFDNEETARKEERADGMVAVVRVLRQRLPIQDRIARMKMAKNCFTGDEMVEAIIQHLDCGRKKVT